MLQRGLPTPEGSLPLIPVRVQYGTGNPHQYEYIMYGTSTSRGTRLQYEYEYYTFFCTSREGGGGRKARRSTAINPYFVICSYGTRTVLVILSREGFGAGSDYSSPDQQYSLDPGSIPVGTLQKHM